MKKPAKRSRGVLSGAVLVLLLAATTQAKETGCLDCHSDEAMEEAARRPALLFSGDAHDRAGLDCTTCHGGDGGATSFRAAHAKKAGFRRFPGDREVLALCTGCHADAGRMKALGAEKLRTDQAERFAKSVHGRVNPVKGFETPTCASCHGAHGVGPRDDPRSKIHPRNVPETCNRCHGDLAYMRAFTSARVRVDQLIEYRTSVHGRRLEEGDGKVAVCSSCHGDHDILPASDPGSSVHPLNVAGTCGRCHSDAEYMKGYVIRGPGGAEIPLPTNQEAAYRRSVHHRMLTEKGDLSAPTCNDCHGNHGATPPEVRTVVTVCAQCHSRPAELFVPSGLKRDLDRAGQRQCVACHGHHEILPADDTTLTRVAEGRLPSGWRPDEAHKAIARQFLTEVRGLGAEIERVEELVARAENYGMDMTRARLALNLARDALVRARVMIHSFDLGKLAEVVKGTDDEPGGRRHVARAEELARAAFRERSFRRAGLAVALAMITLLIVVLVLKIRRMEAAPA